MSNPFLLACDHFGRYIERGVPEKGAIHNTLDGESPRQIRILVIYQKCPANQRLEEAIQELLKKYEKKGKT